MEQPRCKVCKCILSKHNPNTVTCWAHTNPTFKGQEPIGWNVPGRIVKNPYDQVNEDYNGKTQTY
jgi:hypothetical protein